MKILKNKGNKENMRKYEKMRNWTCTLKKR